MNMIWEIKQHSVPENWPKDFKSLKQLTRFPHISDQLVDLNLLLTRCWKYYEGKRNLKMATRFDPLPIVDGDEGQWSFVFAGLLHMIMLHQPKGFFFLHIKCEPCVVQTIPVQLKRGFKYYLIHFYANISAGERWHRLYDDRLKEIAHVINGYNGAFAHHCCEQKGCVFSLTLPGKID